MRSTVCDTGDPAVIVYAVFRTVFVVGDAIKSHGLELNNRTWPTSTRKYWFFRVIFDCCGSMLQEHRTPWTLSKNRCNSVSGKSPICFYGNRWYRIRVGHTYGKSDIPRRCTKGRRKDKSYENRTIHRSRFACNGKVKIIPRPHVRPMANLAKTLSCCEFDQRSVSSV